MNQEPSPREIGYYSQLAQVGTEMALPAGLGAYLDHVFETGPWLTVTLAVFGFVAGLVHLIAIMNAKERGESTKKKKPPT